MPNKDIKTCVFDSPNKFIWMVKDINEVAGPLGGVSTEYLIEVNTSRFEFKTNLQSESAIVNFTISKTFKEIEYFYNKLKSQNSHMSCPDFFTKGKMYSTESNEIRCKVLNSVLQFVSEQQNFMTSVLLKEFLNYQANHCNPEKSQVKKEPSTSQDKVEKINTAKQIPDKQPESQGIFGLKADDDEDDDDLFKKVQTIKISDQPSRQQSSSIHHSGEHLLFQRQDLGGALLKDETDIFVPADAKSTPDSQEPLQLDDASDLLRVDDTLSDIMEEFQKKSTKPPVRMKPVIKPKPNLSTNVAKEKPAVDPRQTLGSSRPVPPPRTTLSAKSTTSPMMEEKSKIVCSTDEIDILDYINKEVNAQNENLDLF